MIQSHSEEEKDFEERIKIAPKFGKIWKEDLEIPEEEINRSATEAIRLPGDDSWLYKGHLYFYRSEDENAKSLIMSYHWARLSIRVYLTERRDQIGIEKVDQIMQGVPESFIMNLSDEISSITNWSSDLRKIIEDYFFSIIANAYTNKVDVNEILVIVNRAKEIYGVDLNSKDIEIDEKILEALAT